MQTATLMESPTLTWHAPVPAPVDPAERTRLWPVIGWHLGTAQIGVVAGRKTVLIESHVEGRWKYRADIWLPGCRSRMGETMADAMAKAEADVVQFIADNPGHWDRYQAS